MEPTFFEGPEKKVEIVLSDASFNLRSLGDAFWHRIVKASEAQVLSTLRNESCDAYLLSESSLFVYDGHFTMLTCGRTRLVNAALLFLEQVPPEKVGLVVYERKNEHWPELQHSTFEQDARRLHAVFPGRALRFGDEHAHFVNLFHGSRNYSVEAGDTTLEILMHDLPENAAAQFVGCERPEGSTIAVERGIDAILPGFAIDEHPFTPAGYSMNGLLGDDYYTIHVTPESRGSYVSFETNADFRGNVGEIVSRVLKVFQPRTFDVVTFVPEGSAPELLDLGESYRIKDEVRTGLDGYAISYWHCYRPVSEARSPVALTLG